jgi:hypothetical protein
MTLMISREDHDLRLELERELDLGRVCFAFKRLLFGRLGRCVCLMRRGRVGWVRPRGGIMSNEITIPDDYNSCCS